MTPTLAWQVDGPPGAPVLVLLNSIGMSTDMWTPCLAQLAEQLQVVRVDTRGHGASPPAAPDAACTIADLGRDVLGVLDELGGGRVHVAGLSLGGMTAMWLAIHHPERVARVAVLCTSAYLPPSQGWLERAATVRAHGMSAIADAAIGRWLTPALVARDPDLVARLRATLGGVDAESYAQCCLAIATLDLRADLGRVAAPTLVIAGRQDPITPPEHGQAIADGIAGARLEVLDPAAHLATVEQPGAVATLLLRHFRAGATLADGYATRRAVLGDEHVQRAIDAGTELTAPFQELLTRYAWGQVWARPELPRRERSIATIAALVTLGAEHELELHVRAAQRNGLTPEEIGEVLLHTALYAGLPRANRAFTIAAAALASPAAPTAPATTHERQPQHDAATTEGPPVSPRSAPPFRADHVGSLLRPAELLRARAEHARDAITTAQLRQAEDAAIREVVRLQAEIGLQSATDGEFRRTSWHMDFIYRLRGVHRTDEAINVHFRNAEGDLEFTSAALRVDGRIGLDAPIFGADFGFLRSVAGDATAKLTIPSPSMVHYRGGPAAIDASVYPDEDEFWADLSAAYAKQVSGIAALGCTYLQLDDTSLAYLNDPAQRAEFAAKGGDGEHQHERYIRQINTALAGRPPGLTVTTHLCRGNYRSSWVAEGGYDYVAEALFGGLDVDGFFLEYDDERSGGFEPLRFVPPGKLVVLGLVTTKHAALESKDTLKRRIDEAARYVPIEQLCLSPQCGFSSTVEGNNLTGDEQAAKLRLIVETAAEVWG